MPKIYLIIDDTPLAMNGEKEIMAAYLSKETADIKIKNLKKRNSFWSEYYEVVPVKINDGPNYNIERKNK